MILFRNRLIIGFIKKIFYTVFLAIYKIISLFNLQITLFLLLLSLVLYITGVFSSNTTILVIDVVLIVLSIVYAFISSAKKVFTVGKGKSSVKIIKPTTPQADEQEETLTRDTSPSDNLSQKPVLSEQPKYYKVKQNPKFIMAEYSDKYILYRITAKGLEKIRTDYKGLR